MIDIHSHIVFGVDDGARDLEQSIKIIKEAEKVGFEKIIATPHYITGECESNKLEIAKRIEQIKESLHQIDCNVEILQGNEIYFDEDINDFLENEKASSLNDGKYVLFELPMNTEVLDLMQVVYKIMEKGRIPVLAHPERYSFVKRNPNVLIPLIESGVLMQSNFGSIMGDYNKDAKKTVEKLLKHNMVHFLASDVHRPGSIYSKIEEAKIRIAKIIGEEKLQELTTYNQEKLLNSEEIDIDAPIQIKRFRIF